MGLFRFRIATFIFAILLQLAGYCCHAEALKTFPALPAGIDPASLPDWLHTYTDIPPKSVVSLVNGVILILQDKGLRVGSGQLTGIVIRREALSGAAAADIGGRSQLIRFELDCDASQYRVLGMISIRAMRLQDRYGRWRRG